MTITLRLKSGVQKDGRTSVFFDVSHSLPNQTKYRKNIYTSTKVNPKQFNKNNFRTKVTHPNYKVINVGLKKLEEMRDTAKDYFDNNQFSLPQVENYLNGKSDFDSVDAYIESEIKNTRLIATYRDYKNTLSAFKLHTKKDKEHTVSWTEINNYKMLDTFKRNAELKGTKGTSINKYLSKLKALYNDAYDKGYIHQEYIKNKKLKSTKNIEINEVKTIKHKHIKKAIKKINSIHDAQALALYLLMFCMRGFYPADVVTLTKKNLKHTKHKDDDLILKLCEDGKRNYIHRRAKTRNQSSAALVIYIDDELFNMIHWLKLSFYFTHYLTPQQSLLADFNDELAIFNYDIEDNDRLHFNLWDSYGKKVKKLLGVPYKTARKSYNTTALELSLSESDRRILLGHADRTMLKHYDNTKSKKMRKKIQKGHLKVLKSFKTSILIKLLNEQIRTLDIPDVFKLESLAMSEEILIKDLKKHKNK